MADNYSQKLLDLLECQYADVFGVADYESESIMFINRLANWNI